MGDNVFYGNGLPKDSKVVSKKVVQNRSAVIFAYYVSDPKRYGVINFDDNGEAISIEEKPSHPKVIMQFLDCIFIQTMLLKLPKIRHRVPEGNWRLQI